MPNKVLLENGTAIILADTTDHSPAAGNNLGTRTDQIDLTSVSAGSYRQSTKFDMTATRGREMEMTAAIEFGTAPTAGGTVDFYVGFSHSTTAGTGNPANLSGADGAYVGYGAAASDATEAINQLVYVGSLVVSNDADIHIGHVGSFVPIQQYGMVVVRNNTDQSLQSDAVEMSIRISPLEDEVQ